MGTCTSGRNDALNWKRQAKINIFFLFFIHEFSIIKFCQYLYTFVNSWMNEAIIRLLKDYLDYVRKLGNYRSRFHDFGFDGMEVSVKI